MISERQTYNVAFVLLPTSRFRAGRRQLARSHTLWVVWLLDAIQRHCARGSLVADVRWDALLAFFLIMLFAASRLEVFSLVALLPFVLCL